MSPLLPCKDLLSPSKVSHQDLASVPHVKDLDGSVRRAGGQSSAVVVHLGVVLPRTHTYTHTSLIGCDGIKLVLEEEVQPSLDFLDIVQ